MRLSVKLSLATAAGILAGLAGPGCERVRREAALFHSDVRRDHQTLGKTIAFLAERADPSRAMQMVEDVNTWQAQVESHWLPDPTAPPHGEATSAEIEADHSGRPYLLTRVPCRIGQPGYVQLKESMSSAKQYLRGTVLATLGVTVLLMAMSTAIIVGLGWLFLGRPMRLVLAKAKRIGAGDLSVPLHLPQRDEMGELAREIDAMCEHLAAAQLRVREEATGRIAALEQLRHADVFRPSASSRLASLMKSARRSAS